MLGGSCPNVTRLPPAWHTYGNTRLQINNTWEAAIVFVVIVFNLVSQRIPIPITWLERRPIFGLVYSLEPCTADSFPMWCFPILEWILNVDIHIRIWITCEYHIASSIFLRFGSFLRWRLKEFDRHSASFLSCYVSFMIQIMFVWKSWYFYGMHVFNFRIRIRQSIFCYFTRYLILVTFNRQNTR